MKTSAGLAIVVASVTMLVFAPGSARADCANPSDTCSPNEIRYLQNLQSASIDVSGTQAATDIDLGKQVCADLRAGAKLSDEEQKVWQGQSGKITRNQSAAIVFGAATLLCPGYGSGA